MDGGLRTLLARSGAVFAQQPEVALHFGDSAAELSAALESCALADRSSLSRLRGDGAQLLDLLHRLSTADLRGLSAGRGRMTVLTSPKGRIIERLFVQHLGERGVLLVGGPGSASRLLAHLARYAFGEATGLVDVTDRTCHIALVGPRAPLALAAAGLPCPERLGTLAARTGGVALDLLGHDGVSPDGFSVVAAAEDGAAVWNLLRVAVSGVGGRSAGEEALEARRILRGIPASGHELTGDHNPLEAGLVEAVSFDKGCYVGQEVVARLRTYDKVARRIVGLELPAECAVPAPGTPLYVAGHEVGRVTSAVLPGGWSHAVALAYVKWREMEPDADLRLGAPEGVGVRRVELPFEHPAQALKKS
jgi:folate-binding protein YgfZ